MFGSNMSWRWCRHCGEKGRKIQKNKIKSRLSFFFYVQIICSEESYTFKSLFKVLLCVFFVVF